MTGIRKTATSYQVFVRVPAKYRDRYPFAVYTKRYKLHELADAKHHYLFIAPRIKKGLTLTEDEAPAAPMRTLKDDAAEYLKLIPSMPSARWRRDDINLWIAALGDLPRVAITRTHVRAQLERWRTVGPKKVWNQQAKGYVSIEAPLSADTVNHRRTALSDLYTRLDGKTARNPARDVPKYARPDAPPRALPTDLVDAAFAVMPRTKPTARLRVIRWTGWPQAQLRKVREQHIDFRGHQAEVQKRLKGKGWEPRVLPLLPQAVAALREMKRLDAFGTFRSEGLNRSWRAALEKVRAQVKAKTIKLSPAAIYWIDHARVYDLRHWFATMLAHRTPDRAARQELMMHSDPRQTAFYERAAASPITRAALGIVANSLSADQKRQKQAQKRRTQ